MSDVTWKAMEVEPCLAFEASLVSIQLKVRFSGIDPSESSKRDRWWRRETSRWNAIYAPRTADWTLKSRNDLRLWEIEVETMCFHCLRAQRYYYDLYRCHVEAAVPKNIKRGKNRSRRRLLYLDFKREIGFCGCEIPSIMNEVFAAQATPLKRTQIFWYRFSLMPLARRRSLSSIKKS